MINYGFNGTNTASVLTPEVIALLTDMMQPGQELAYRIRNDKYESPMPDTDIANIIALRNSLVSKGSDLFAIYTFDTRNQVSLDDNFYGFNALIDAGINIYAAELGNEEWADVAGHGANWQVYFAKCEPILDKLNVLGFFGKRIFPITQNNPRFVEWDDEGINTINSNSFYEPVLHLYYNQTEIPIISTLNRDELPKSVYNPDTYIADKDDFFKTFTEQFFTSNLFEANINFVNSRMPGKKIWFTEYGPGVNTGNLQNTLAFHMTDFNILLQSYDYQDNIAVMCKHNGPTTPLTGMISKKSNFDVYDAEFIPRLSYHTMKLFLSNIGQPNSIPFINASREEVLLDNNDSFDAAEIIKGNNWYSSSGKCEWWADGSVGDMEINGITMIPFGYNPTFPALSYGFYYTDPIDEIPGCTDPDALNYNPLATMDDGSCIYPVPGCMDPTASNYNPAATVDDGSCVYPVYGCTDPNALNYDPNATVDNGSCTYKPKKKSLRCKILELFGINC